MPQYNTSPFAAGPVQLQPAVPEYLLGRRNMYTPDARMAVTGVVDNGTTAAYAVSVLDGNVPVVGALFTAQTNNATYNVVNAPITAVNIAASGAGTISVASVATGTVAIGGVAIVPVPEIPETLVAGSSIPGILPMMSGSAVNRTLMAECTFPTIPTGATVNLQSAMRNIDSEYVNLQQVGVVAGGAVTTSQAYFTGNGMFYRFNVSGITGTGTITAKIVVGQ